MPVLLEKRLIFSIAMVTSSHQKHILNSVSQWGTRLAQSVEHETQTLPVNEDSSPQRTYS